MLRVDLTIAIGAAAALIATTALAQPAPTPVPAPSLRGEMGESCRARADCQDGLKCMDQVCVDPREGQSCGARADCGTRLQCIDQVCVKPGATPPPAPPPVAPPPTPPSTAPAPVPPDVPPSLPPPSTGDEPPPPLEPQERSWMDFEIGDGIHPYAGLTLAPGVFLGLDFPSGQTTSAFASFLFSVRGGVMFGSTVLELELSPMTWVPVLDSGDPTLNLNLSIGSYNQLTEGVYWPTRFGVGLQYVDVAKQTLFQTRLDMLGIAFDVGHVLIDLYIPSFRFTTEFDQVGTFNWLFGAGAAYVF